jgi:hypothetical protein
LTAAGYLENTDPILLSEEERSCLENILKESLNGLDESNRKLFEVFTLYFDKM